jgi:hypothetical protein
VSRYILIRRLRGPAILLLVGVIALLHTAGIVHHFWHFWPLLLILVGVFMLAERAALSAEGFPPYPGTYPGAAAPGAFDPATGQPTPTQYPAQPGTSIVPAAPHDLDKFSSGGQS